MFYTDRLFIRQVDPEADTKLLLQWFNDVDFASELGAPGPVVPSSRDKIKKLVERLADKEDKLPCFIVCERPREDKPQKDLDPMDDFFMKDGKPRYPAIGLLNISYRPGNSTFNRCVILGVILDEKHRDHGLGTELLRWALSFCFKDLGMHRIELGTSATNHRALHVYEKKLGFTREGLKRKNALRNGEWLDTVDLGLLVEEWESQEGNHRNSEDSREYVVY